MAFVNSVKQCFLTGASCSVYVSMTNTAVTAGVANINVNIPSPQYFNFGMLRVKSLTPGTAANIRVTGLWASDGNASNITQLYSGDTAVSAYPCDLNYDSLITDIKANQVIVGVNVGVTGSVDIEFAGV